MSDEKKQRIIGSVGVIYNSGHMTIYSNGDKAVNCNGALRIGVIVGFHGDNPLFIDYSKKEEFDIRKVKIK